jgi:hypothetical protein
VMGATARFESTIRDGRTVIARVVGDMVARSL